MSTNTHNYCNHPSYCGYADTMSHDDDRHEKWEKQYNERGFDDSVTWSFDCKLVEWIIPRLERFIEISEETTNADEFHAKCKVMLEGFKFYLSDDFNEFNEKHMEIIDKSFKLLAENYRGLWW
jgi:ATP-dependent helicase/DNAse subunit B